MQKTYYILTTLALLLTACSDHGEIDGTLPVPPEVSDVAINFESTTEQVTLPTRGVLIGNLEATVPNDHDGHQPWTTPWVKGDFFTTHAYYYFDSMTTLGQKFMNGLEVEYVPPPAPSTPASDDTDDTDDTDATPQPAPVPGEWIYAPVKMWPQNGYLDFFAQYPSDEMLAKMRINVEVAEQGTMFPDQDITLPEADMEEVDIFESGSASNARRIMAEDSGLKRSAPSRATDDHLLPRGISSLRFWHESPQDTVISFRLKMHPHAMEPPLPNTEGKPNAIPVTEYDDAEHQPDLMYAHHPHLAKPSVSSKVDFSFTHAMMAVRFWLKGADRRDDDDFGHDLRVGSRFRNISNFTINSVSFGPVYSAGECVAYDNTDWKSYYQGFSEATQHSDVHVKLRYVWKYCEAAPQYTVRQEDGSDLTYTMAPPYGGAEYRTPIGNAYAQPPVLLDPAYPLPEAGVTDIFSQRCDYSLLDYGDFDIEATKTVAGWQPAKSVPILPVFDKTRGLGPEHSAFIIPPQMFLQGNPYIKVTYTITESTEGGIDPETLTFTTETVSIPMTDTYINVEDGEILDLYFTFDIDGDDYFKFLIDAQVTPWQHGGSQDEEWKNW